jgi:hypothetical protein
MTKKLLFVKELLLRGMNSTLAVVVLNSIMDSVVLLTVLTFSATAFITLVVFGDFVWISLRAHLCIVVLRYGSSHYWLTPFELKPYSLMQLYRQVVCTDCVYCD